MTWEGDNPNKSVLALSYEKISHILAAQEPKQKALNPDLVVGIARGGICPASMVSSNLMLPMFLLSVTRGTDLIEWMAPPNDVFFNQNPPKRVLLVDDMMSSGLSIQRAKVFLEGLGFEVFLNVVFYDTLCPIKPDVGEMAERYIKFPWEKREDTPGSKKNRGDGSSFHYTKEVDFFGFDLDGIFTPDLPNEFYMNDLDYALRLRDQLLLLPSAPTLSEALQKNSAIITGRPSSDYKRTRDWLNINGLIDIQLFCRDESRFAHDFSGAVGSKIESISKIGVSRFFESDPIQALEIAKALPAIDVIWWRPFGNSIRVSAGAFDSPDLRNEKKGD